MSKVKEVSAAAVPTAATTANAVAVRQVGFSDVLGNFATFQAICSALSKSGNCRGARTPESVLAVAIQGAELGIPPMTAVQCIHNIQGQLTLSASTCQALVLRDLPGSRFTVEEETAEKCVVLLECPGRPAYRSEFTIAEAKTAGLVKPGGNWVKSPRDMLFARAVMRACRRVAPDVLAGMYAAEEFEGADIAPAAPQPVEQPAPAPAAPVVDTTVAEVAALLQPVAATIPPAPAAPLATPAQLNELWKLKQTHDIGTVDWMKLLAKWLVNSARDLEVAQADELIAELRKRPLPEDKAA